jgi:protein-S-isoprenylcysteine O-methyltransferase Ste14
VYRWTRHPIYVAFDTLFVGAFLLNGRASFLALAVVWVPLLHGVMGREERFLTRLYGEAYREYCRHVGRYLPAAQGFIGWLNAANARPKARWVQGLLALGGGLVFLVLIPLALCGLGTMVLPWSRGWVPRGIEVGVGLVAGVLGLALALWSVATFWHTGRGTPVPVAAPQRLVVSGPFAYCRNPMYLGVMMYYLGLASLVVSLPFGVAVSGLGLLVGALYAKEVEEKELPLRFGAAYEEYRRRTPLFLPRWPPKGPGA